MEKTTESEQIKQIIRENIEHFFNKATLNIEITEIDSLTTQDAKEHFYVVRLFSPQAHLLIGRHGSILYDIQSLLSKIISKQLGFFVALDLDINHYKSEKERYLKDLARRVAEEVSLTGKEKALFAMPPFDRRIIHLELAHRNDVSTESIGEAENRKVVIKPLFKQENQ